MTNGMGMAGQYSKMEATMSDFGRMIKNAEREKLFASIKKMEKLQKKMEFGIRVEN